MVNKINQKKEMILLYKIFRALINIVWVLDILNLPFMQFLDTTYPINGWAWFLILLVIPATAQTIKVEKE